MVEEAGGRVRLGTGCLEESACKAFTLRGKQAVVYGKIVDLGGFPGDGLN